MDLKALIVDDEAISRKLLKTVLVGNFFDVTVAASGEQAIDILCHTDFDVIITDLQMKKVNGNEVVRKARERGGHSVVFMITSSREPRHEIEAFNCGVDEYLHKPFSVDVVLNRLRCQLLKHRGMPEEVRCRLAQ